MGETQVDFIVVGAGSAGCALAARLVQHSTDSVALIEAGGSDDHPYVRMPMAWMQVMMMPRFGWGTVSEPEPYMDGRVQPLPRGRVLGGCSTINGTMYIRGMAADYDGWRDSGLPGWGYEDVLPYFKRAETNWRGAGPEHGGSGPLSVTPLAKHPDFYPAYRDAAQAMGYREIADFNVAEPEGFAMPDCTIRNGRRDSTSDAYLKPALNRPNLRLVTDATVNRVVLEAGRAVGVEFERGGVRHVMRARREVILCAGSFHSPHLLMLSGIGPGAELQKHGIQPIVDLPGVGANLQDHAIALSIWQARRPNTFERELRLDRLLFNVLRWSITGRGTPAQSPLSIQGFIRSDASVQRPDLQFQASHVSYAARPWFPFVRPGVGHQVSAGSLLLDPRSRGRVSLASPDPKALPRILLNFLADEEDRRKLREAMRFMRRFFRTDAAQSVVSTEIAPGERADTDEALDGWLRASVISAAHPTSTCAMGTGPQAVVDAELRVRGVGALRVADCSIMPRIIRGNTNAPAIMIGEKAADLVLDRPPLR
jgi:choline dehydrogenase